LKRPLATLDVVVTAVEWGHGKRKGVLSDYTFAVKDTSTGRLLNVGKAYTGLTDAEIAAMTERFLDITIEDHGHVRLVRPEVILEVAFDSIQRSARHKSGYALRFPRIVRVRDDKPVEEIDTVERVAELYDRYFGEKSAVPLSEVAKTS
jgi:DNA ligase-1